MSISRDGEGQRHVQENASFPLTYAHQELAKTTITTALMIDRHLSNSSIARFINVLPLHPGDACGIRAARFGVQQWKTAEDALAIMAAKVALPPAPGVFDHPPRRRIPRKSLERRGAPRPTSSSWAPHRQHRHAMRTYFLDSVPAIVYGYPKCLVLVVRN